MRYACVVLALAVGLLLLAGCGTDLEEAEPSEAPIAEQPADYTPEFVEDACVVEPPDDITARCGFLIVPEDRMQPDGPVVELAVVVLESLADAPAPDPIFYLEGGPGGTALSGLEVWQELGFLDRRDMVILAQRGTAFSTPHLNCPEEEAEDYADELDAIAACYERLRAEGVNLEAYTSAANAADVEDVRQALGYDEINLLGISYGTRLALTVLRDHPDHIRSVVLDSTYPPEVDAVAEDVTNMMRMLERLFRDCAASSECAAAYPNLETVFYTQLLALESDPVALDLIDPETDEEFTQTVDDYDLIETVYEVFYDTEAIPFLPAMISATTEEDFRLLVEFAEWGVLADEDDSEDEDEFADEDDSEDEAIDEDSEGMFYSVQCHEETPFADEALFDQMVAEAAPELVLWATDSFEYEQEVCELWESGEADSRENEPVASDIPALVLAGEYDVATPPEWGQQAAAGLSSSFYVEFPGYGHGISLDGGCPTTITLDFLDDPTSEPAAACLDERAAPEFIISE